MRARTLIVAAAILAGTTNAWAQAPANTGSKPRAAQAGATKKPAKPILVGILKSANIAAYNEPVEPFERLCLVSPTN